MNSTKFNSLGHIYVKYLDPINLNEWMKTQWKGNLLGQSNIEAAALQLTTNLMERQQMETPVTLNSLLSS